MFKEQFEKMVEGQIPEDNIKKLENIWDSQMEDAFETYYNLLQKMDKRAAKKWLKIYEDAVKIKDDLILDFKSDMI